MWDQSENPLGMKQQRSTTGLEALKFVKSSEAYNRNTAVSYLPLLHVIFFSDNFLQVKIMFNVSAGLLQTQ